MEVIRLFDSLFRNYPVGAFLLWETQTTVPFREFFRDFDPEVSAVDSAPPAAFSRRKFLVYDGQQRLQSLYSCLQYTFARQVLCFDLYFDATASEDQSYGFSFQNQKARFPASIIALCELYEEFRNQGVGGRSDYRRKKLLALKQAGASEQQLACAEYNIDRLWSLFNDEANEVCGYFEIPTGLTKEDVREIFVRLNTGGVVPTQADLVFSMIAGEHFDFQQQIDTVVGDIRNAVGIDLEADDILQILFFLIYKTRNLELNRLDEGDVDQFQKVLTSSIEPIKTFYKRFLFDEFRINTTSVYRSQGALLPLLYFFCHRRIYSLTEAPKSELKQFFILSQFKDWSLQALLSSFADLITKFGDFPLDQMKQVVVKNGRRQADLTEQDLENLPAFALKVMIPKRHYTLIPNRGRLNPEVEHIFPKNPRETDLPACYAKCSRSLWNLQLGVPGDLNSQKRRQMPRIFFRGRESDLKMHYEFLPTSDLDDEIWDYHHIDKFCKARKQLMIKELQQLYGIEVSASSADLG